MMLLRDLLAPWLHYAGAQSFNNLTLDSRAIRRGDVFWRCQDIRSMADSLLKKP
ncbi:hypothetical protein GCM10025855_31260 [Shewanella glacialipiscicola]|uniref:Uncharacterized protein n=1 Tax=Shewanella glacialipiscicola TaxID=614069 RepID=A0ABQ6J623_9GAMM|nr:hypothetical protein GCM10025855_31260 [Shewanella glacialipiscicola]